MREILFRGKRIYDEKWIYGNLVIDNFFEPHIVPRDFFFEDGHHLVYDDETDSPVFVFKDSIGQYTGLKDKSGVKIFENDIVRYGKKNWVVNWNDETFRWEISLKDGCYQYPIYDGQGYPKYVDRITLGWVAAEFQLSGQLSVEVIGNKFDNPELIERDNNEKDWIF